jgi:hypothetical protein
LVESGETWPGASATSLGGRGAIEPVVMSASAATALTGDFSNGMVMLHPAARSGRMMAPAAKSDARIAQNVP